MRSQQDGIFRSDYSLITTRDHHTFKLTAKVTLDKRFQQTGDFDQETAEAVEMILAPKVEKWNRGSLLIISDVKVELIFDAKEKKNL